MYIYIQSKDGDDGLVVLIQDDNVIQYRLPVWRKICFAIGGVPYQMTNAVVSFFFSIFLLEVAEVCHIVRFIKTHPHINCHKETLFVCCFDRNYNTIEFEIVSTVFNLRYLCGKVWSKAVHRLHTKQSYVCYVKEMQYWNIR